MIQETPLSERPRERCLDFGPSCLSLRECLALILGSGPKGVGCLGLATLILQRPGRGLGEPNEERAFFNAMEASSGGYLKEILGLGPAGQAKVLAAFELGRRYALHRTVHLGENPQYLTSLSKAATKVLSRISLKLRSASQEWIGFIPIYKSGKMGDFCLVERGTRTHVNIDPAELFARILALRPDGFFLFHNHPSGNTLPSHQDFELTRKIAEISQELGIRLFGHWVVTSQSEHWIDPGGQI